MGHDEAGEVAGVRQVVDHRRAVAGEVVIRAKPGIEAARVDGDAIHRGLVFSVGQEEPHLLLRRVVEGEAVG